MKNRIMTLTGWLVMAAALTAGMTACSSEDNIADGPTPTTETPKTYTMTVTASKTSDDATTRALTIDDKTMNATWTAGDAIRVMKRRQQSSDVIFAELGTLTATTVSADGLSATFTGSLDADKVSSAGGLTAGDLLLFGYPGTHLGASTSAYVFNYNGQDGTLQTLASNYDYCMTTTSKSKMVTVASVDGGVVTTTGTASFTNQQAIVRFTLTESDGTTPVCPTSLDITAIGLEPSVALPETGTGISPTPTEKTLTLTLDGSTNVIYAALRGISGRDVTLTATTSGGRIFHYTKSDVTFTNGKYYAINVKMSTNLAALTADYTAQDGDLLTGTLPSGIHLSIAAGASVTLKNVTISDASQAGITCLGDATIILDGTNTVTTTAEKYPAIQAGGSGTTLTIQGSGSVTATGGLAAAGIGSRGGNDSYVCGNITISGGTVTAEGGNDGAGIGSGNGGARCGVILISGGTVTANGGSSAAGIGSGGGGYFESISITDGITSVTAKKGSVDYAVPIGRGYEDTTSGTVTIDGVDNPTASSTFEHLTLTASGLTWTLTHK